jgi:hypothetical protein
VGAFPIIYYIADGHEIVIYGKHLTIIAWVVPEIQIRLAVGTKTKPQNDHLIIYCTVNSGCTLVIYGKYQTVIA